MLKTSSYSKHTDYYQLWLEKKKENNVLTVQLVKSKKMVVGLQQQLAEFFRNMALLESCLELSAPIQDDQPKSASDCGSSREESEVSKKSDPYIERTSCEVQQAVRVEDDCVTIEPSVTVLDTLETRTKSDVVCVDIEPVSQSLEIIPIKTPHPQSTNFSSSSSSRVIPDIVPDIVLEPIPNKSQSQITEFPSTSDTQIESHFILPDGGSEAAFEMLETTVIPEEFPHSHYQEPTTSKSSESTSIPATTKVESGTSSFESPESTCLYRNTRRRRKNSSAPKESLVSTATVTTLDTQEALMAVVKMEVSDEELIEFHETALPCEEGDPSSSYPPENYGRDNLEPYQVGLMECSSNENSSYQEAIEGYSVEEPDNQNLVSVSGYERLKDLGESSRNPRRSSNYNPGRMIANRIAQEDPSQNMSPPKGPKATKRNLKSFSEKLDILREFESSNMKRSKLARELNIPSSTLYSIVSKKDKIVGALVSGKISQQCKRLRRPSWPELESYLQEWIKTFPFGKRRVPGLALKAKAKEIALSLGFERFKASNRWLTGFKRRSRELSIWTV